MQTTTNLEKLTDVAFLLHFTLLIINSLKNNSKTVNQKYIFWHASWKCRNTKPE